MLLSRVDIAASASSSRIEMDPNLLVRLFAVLQTLQQPFEAWSQLVHDARAERLISVRSRAAETVRTARQRSKLLEQTAGRLRKQDETLRSLGNRVRLRQLHAHWRAEARERARCQFAARVLLVEWLWRWRSGAVFHACFGPPRGARLARKQGAAGLRAFRASACAGRWLAVLVARLELRRALRRWRRHRAVSWRYRSAAAASERNRRRCVLLRAVRSWHQVMLRQTRGGLLALQDGALTSLLRLWSSSAHEAVRVLSAWPGEADADADAAAADVLRLLGGHWAGGASSLEVAVREANAYKAKLSQERQSVISAAMRGEGSAVRVEELFAMIRQQRANHAALAAVVRRSEAELLCLQRSLQAEAAPVGSLATGEAETTSLPAMVAAIVDDFHGATVPLGQRLAECDAKCRALQGRLDGIEQRLPARVRRAG